MNEVLQLISFKIIIFYFAVCVYDSSFIHVFSMNEDQQGTATIQTNTSAEEFLVMGSEIPAPEI
jgi:hypothetical protein